MHINWIGKSSELKLHCFCLFDAYSMPENIYSVELKGFVLLKVVSFNVQSAFPLDIEYASF
jgi:hypothetical protein